jgi:hypothetical protein
MRLQFFFLEQCVHANVLWTKTIEEINYIRGLGLGIISEMYLWNE